MPWALVDSKKGLNISRLEKRKIRNVDSVSLEMIIRNNSWCTPDKVYASKIDWFIDWLIH